MTHEEPSIDLNAIKTLYSRSLYSIDSYDTEQVDKTVPVVPKKVLVLVRDPLQPGDPLYTFLQGILEACRLKMNDINLLPYSRQ
ncbi:MAG TPA: hypothetical protein VLA58_01245, partial [Chitinophagaceae bacterium]|nr:hypothetical protein [Chitinophagaceae bacterium]